MAIINCASCSQDDFEHAYYVLSSPGDTIVLPAGSATWGNSSRGNQGVIYIITEVTVMGQGDDTIITLDDTGKTYATGVIACWAAAHFKSFKIIGSNVNPVTAFHISSYNNPTTGINFIGGFRLSDITYVGGTADAYFAFISSGVLNGLIDNCRLTGNNGGAELITGRGPTDAWQTNNTLGQIDNIFIEDCTFNNQGYVCDANSNARFVVRFNTINGVNKIDGHGLASNSPARSCRHLEIYNNNFTKTGAGNWQNIEIRGGTARIFNNACVAGYLMLTDYGYQGTWPNYGYLKYGSANYTGSNPTTVSLSLPHDFVNGMIVRCQSSDPSYSVLGNYPVTVIDSTHFSIPVNTAASGNFTGYYATRYQTLADYPLGDQVGMGKDPISAHSEPAYLWGNSQNGGAWPRTTWDANIGTDAIATYRLQTGNPTGSFTERSIIHANRDFFADSGYDTDGIGVNTGTRAQMDSLTPTSSGYGFWVTDEGSWNSNLSPNSSGRFYIWSGSSWNLNYTPYTYPHPLRASGSVSSSNYRHHHLLSLTRSRPMMSRKKYSFS